MKQDIKKCRVVPFRVHTVMGQLLSQFSLMPELNQVYSFLFSNKGTSFFARSEKRPDNSIDFAETYLNTHRKALPLLFIRDDMTREDFFYYMADSDKDIDVASDRATEICPLKLNPDYWLSEKHVLILGSNSNVYASEVGYRFSAARFKFRAFNFHVVEVADGNDFDQLRAAFKAVMEGMQVAVLVPTTILAQQHYNTFVERMRRYPVTIGMLSRFRTPAEQKQTISEVKEGICDIVIGTHRLLSKDVKFKNLGLLVVDEEQRFGVTHKEKIKKMKENVDVLTLSATPIPRTLHMSLVGIRDMSVLEEAPEGRVPIQTYVMEYDEEMVREAIIRELSRKGQVYYVHNRVNDIDSVTSSLQQLVPEARVAFAHGRMGEEQLEKIMYDFIDGEIDVLVSTTIIETGLDISNVNTIIIRESDKMGLSQLYQLRGRVGRTGRTAYAFLMYRRDRILREVAEKRLRAIREYTELGSGFKIAMRDLEIRGAGSMLGRAQHGHMQAVGYDLYCKLLNTAVKQAKGEPVKEERTVRVGLSVDAFLPESYIINEEQKLEIYKKIAAIESTEDYDDVREELKDRFGDIPAPAGNLLRIALIRSVAARIGIIEIAGTPGTIRFYMDPKAKVHAENIPSLLRNYRKNLAFSMKGFSGRGVPEFMYQYKAVGVTVRDEEILLTSVEELLVAMANELIG